MCFQVRKLRAELCNRPYAHPESCYRRALSVGHFHVLGARCGDTTCENPALALRLQLTDWRGNKSVAHSLGAECIKGAWKRKTSGLQEVTEQVWPVSCSLGPCSHVPGLSPRLSSFLISTLSCSPLCWLQSQAGTLHRRAPWTPGWQPQQHKSQCLPRSQQSPKL